MLAERLVRAIEERAEDLTRGVLDDLASNDRTPSYHHLSRAQLHGRVHEVYLHLRRYLDADTDEAVSATFGAVGRERRAEGTPLEEVVYALMLTKQHLLAYILHSGLVTSIVDLYQEEDLIVRLEQFFDRAVYHLVKGYQAAARVSSAA
jgi:hypothetical protein